MEPSRAGVRARGREAALAARQPKPELAGSARPLDIALCPAATVAVVTETAQAVASIGFGLLFLAGFGMGVIRENIAYRRSATGYKFDQIERSVHSVAASLGRLDDRIGRIESRLQQHSDEISRDVRTLRSDLTDNRRELARIASAAGPRASNG
jgi:hypothetical protein